MSRTFTWRQRARYRFDNSLSRGIWGVLAWLGVIALAFFLAIAIFILVTGIGPGGEPTTFPEALWYALTRSLDPGTFSGDDGLGFRLIMLVVTIVGIFLAAAIIGLVSSAIDRRVENLRRGKSLVVEEGHTLILGMSNKLVPIVSELVEANASERNRAIVALTPEDTVELSDMIHSEISDFQTSRLIVRSGTPTRLADLQQGNPATAKSIIILRGESDAQVVKAALGVLSCLSPTTPTSVVAELEDSATARALTQASAGRVLTVTSSEIVALIGAQVARAPGLGAIYQELLDFSGDELYSTAVTEVWAGRSFGEALLSSSRGTIIGMRTAGGLTTISPNPATSLSMGDFLIGIAEDDSAFALDEPPVDWESNREHHAHPDTKEREHTLLIGWSPLAPRVARELDRHVAPGSQIHLLVNETDEAVQAIRTAMTLDNQELTVRLGDPIHQPAVHAALDSEDFNHVLLLSEHGPYDADEADARTMLALLHVHSHQGRDGGPENVVAELLDPNDVELTGRADNRDFIVSQRLIALLMAQLSENPHLQPVFEEIFDSDGANILVRPASRYVRPGRTTFREIVTAVREEGGVAIGYRAASAVGGSGTLSGGIRVNPPKDEPVVLGDGDSVIVIARG